jgi:small subunit ribosomal protein S5
MAYAPAEQKEFDEKVIQISRVSKKTKGGNKMGFSILMVVGDRKGKVGVGLGKAKDVLSAIRKGVKKAKKHMINVPLNGTTIPFSIMVKKGAGKVLLKPAPKGSGVIAGGPVRAVVEAAGVRDISSKILGSENQASNVYATFEALQQISTLVKLKGIELKSIAESEAEEAKVLEQEQKKAKQKAVEKHAEELAKKPTVKKPVAKKTLVQKAPAKKAPAKQAPAKKVTAK